MHTNESRTVKRGDTYPAAINPALTWEDATWSDFVGKVATFYLHGTNAISYSKALQVSALGTQGARLELHLTSADSAALPIGVWNYEIRITLSSGSYVTAVGASSITVLDKLW